MHIRINRPYGWIVLKIRDEHLQEVLDRVWREFGDLEAPPATSSSTFLSLLQKPHPTPGSTGRSNVVPLPRTARRAGS